MLLLFILFFQSLDFDRDGLTKMKKAAKAISNGGNGKGLSTIRCILQTILRFVCSSLYYAAHVDNEVYLSKALERLGANAMTKDQEPDIGAAFIKFSIVTKELSALMKTLVSLPCKNGLVNFEIIFSPLNFRCKISTTLSCFRWIIF